MDDVKTQIYTVREFGRSKNYEPLINAKWNADEYDAWELSSITAYLLNAKGLYKTPMGNVTGYLVFLEIEDLR